MTQPKPRDAQGKIIPVLPYAGTSGWSGSDTSRERAEREDSDGTTTERQRLVLEYVGAGEHDGATVKELRTDFGWHHGQASGALSNLHKAGYLARLTERRERCAVYVLPEFVQDRETAPHGNNKPKPDLVLATQEEVSADVPQPIESGDAALLREQWRKRALQAEATLKAARKAAEPMAVTMTHGQLIGAYTKVRTLLQG